MAFVGCAQVYDRQHHENEGLQRNYQNMENRPWSVKCPLHPEWQQCNQDKDNLASIHVAKQSQCQTEWFGQQAKNFQKQVERNQRPMVKRSERQLLGETTKTFDLDRKSTRLNSSHVRISYAV